MKRFFRSAVAVPFLILSVSSLVGCSKDKESSSSAPTEPEPVVQGQAPGASTPVPTGISAQPSASPTVTIAQPSAVPSTWVPVSPTPSRSEPVTETKSEVRCSSTDSCHEAVGLLRSSESADACTVVFVGGNKALTQKNCVSASAALSSFGVSFPATDHQAAAKFSVVGARVLKSDLVELALSASPERAAVALDTVGLADLGNAYVYSFKISKGGLSAEMASQTCRIHDAAINKSGLSVARDCKVGPASRGAPVFDSRGKLRGLIHSAAPDSLYDSRYTDLAYITSLKGMAAVTIDPPAPTATPSVSVTRTPVTGPSASPSTAPTSEPETHVVPSAFREWAAANGSILRWKLGAPRIEKKRSILHVEPECIENPSGWVNDFKGPFGLGYQNKATLEFEAAPTFEADSKGGIKAAEAEKIEVDLEPYSAWKWKSSEVSVRVVKGFFSRTTRFEGTVSVCQ